MKDIEKILAENKKHFNELEAPEEMEMRLSNALNTRKAKDPQWKKIAMVASLIIVFIFTYNYNTFAYYGKKLLGYDTILSQTLQDLNELGKGQEIGKSVTFDNGAKIILDGIMVDDNQLLAFYRIKDPNIIEEHSNLNISPLSINGFFKEYNPGFAQGEFKKESHEVVMIHSFESPSFYEKKLKLKGSFEVNGQFEEFSIDFTLDRNKAMGHSIKQNINKSITLDHQEIHFKDIVATQTQTVIKGSLASLLDLAMEQVSGQQVRPAIDFNLIANGKTLEPLGSGLSSGTKGITFDHIFDTLPKDLEELKLQIKHLTIEKKVNKKIAIQKEKTKEIEVEGQRISILEITESIGDRTEITIESEESVLLPGIQLVIDGQAKNLEEMHSEEYIKTNNQILKRRTLSFKGTGKDLQLKLNKIHYKKEYDEIIDIPIK